MRIMKKSIVIIVSIIMSAMVLLSGLSVFLMFLLPKFSAEEVPMYERVYNEDIKTPINEPTYDDLVSAREADIYVDVENGDDKNDGRSEESAVKSLFVAQEKARVLKESEGRNIKVLIREGEYLLDREWYFDERDNGIAYENYPLEYPVISTSFAITEWTPHGDGIYVANIPSEYNVDLLGENGVIGTIARYPNEGYLYVDSQPDKIKNGVEPKTNSFGYGNDKVIDSLKNTNGLQVKMFAGGPYGEWNWFSHIYPVTNLDKNKNLITLDRSDYPSVYYIGKGSRYIVQNALELLDKDGEYYVDNGNHRIYYKPTNRENLTNGKVQINTSSNVINVVGDKDSVSDLTFSGLALKGSGIGNVGANDNGIIRLENTNGVTIKNCKLYQGGKYGIVGVNGTNNLVVESNWIYDLGHSGVQIFGNEKDAYTANSINNLVNNNYIHDMGLIYGHGVGIQFICVKDSKITNNTITRTPRYSISLKGIGEEDIFRKLNANPDMAYDFGYGNNLIAYNDCSMANLDTQDTGVIEMFSAGADNKVVGNYIHDSYIYFSFGSALYIDDYNIDTLVEENIFYNLGAKSAPSQKGHKYGELMAVIFAKFHGNKIINNYIIDCNATTAILLADYDRIDSVEQITDAVVEKNLIVNTYNSQTLLAGGFFRKFSHHMIDIRKSNLSKNDVISNIEKYVVSNNNIVYNDNTPSFKIGKEYAMAIGGNTAYSLDNWVKKSGQDKNSVFGSVVNIDKNTFDIDTNNQYIQKTGIKQIDFAKVGVKDSWYKQ